MAQKSLSDLQRPTVAEYKQQPKAPFALVLDNVRSALNVGAAFRTGDAFGIQTLYLCGITAQPPHREILKTAIGATESVDWQYRKTTLETLRELREAGYLLAAVEQTTDSVTLDEWTWKPDARVAFVVGNEVNGVSAAVLEAVDIHLEVPQYGTKHSLNVSVCAGIVLWEAIRQWRTLSPR